MARVVRFHEIGSPEVLKVEDVEVPAPRAEEVQIRVKAMGLNRQGDRVKKCVTSLGSAESVVIL